VESSLSKVIYLEVITLNFTIDTPKVTYLRKDFFTIRSNVRLLSDCKVDCEQSTGNILPAIQCHKAHSIRLLPDFESFKSAIALECIEGSGIAESLFNTCVEFHTDLEFGIGGDIETPIHKALNWTYTRFGQQVKSNLFAAFYLQETNDPWQVKLSNPIFDKVKNKSRKYETPKGNGSRAYFPAVDIDTRLTISKRYGVLVPVWGSFWDWLEQHPEISIIITEGGKKSLCLLSNGYIAIALTGVNGGYRTTQHGVPLPAPELIPDLQRFTASGRKFILAFDSDSKPETIRKVNGAINKTAKLITEAGCDIAIARWDNHSGIAKGVDDLIVNFGLDSWHRAYTEAKNPTHWHIQDKYSCRLKHHKPTLTINVPDLSTAIAPETIPARGIVGIVSDYGTGKTLLVNEVIKAETKVIKVGHRRSLERNAATRLNLSFINDLDRVGDQWINIKEQRFLTKFEENRITVLFESLLKIKPEQVENSDLILDEGDQSLRAVMTSSTCRKDGRRPILLKHFESLLKAAKRVILLSADLGDREINYICRLRGEQPSMILLNKYKRPRGKLRLLDSNNDSVAVAEILTKARAGQKLLIPIDSLTRAKAIARLLAPMVGNDKIFNFNSQTSSSPEGLEFAGNPDLFLQTYQPQIALITPSGFTGLSLTSGYFNEIYGLFYGKSVVTDDCLQALERDRLPIPRTVWAAKFGSSFSSAGKETNPIELKGNLKVLNDATGHLLRNELTPEKTDSLKRYQWVDNPHLDLWAEYESDRNFSMWNFRDCLHARLEMSGYDLEIVDTKADNDTKALMKEAIQAIKLEDAIATAKAVELNKSEAKALDDKLIKTGLTPDEQLALEKHHISQWYALPSEDITTDDVLFDNKGKLRAGLQKLEYIFFPELATESDINKISKFAPPDSPATVWDFGHSQLQRKVLESIGFYEFLDFSFSGGVWTKDTEIIKAIGAKCREYIKDIKRSLKVDIGDKMTDVALIGVILKGLGLTTTTQRLRVNGKRVRFTKLHSEHLSRIAVILARRAERLTNSRDNLVPHGLYNTFLGAMGRTKTTHSIEQNAPPTG